MHVAPDFSPRLAGVDVRGLDRSESTAYALRVPELTLAYCNDAWTRFATDNGAPGDLTVLCTDHVSMLALIDPVLRPFYRSLFDEAVRTGRPVSHDYACPSPALERWYRMRITPLRGGLLVVHHLVVERPHRREGAPPVPERYVDPETGLATQCCHCRATQRVDDRDTWDWVPAYLDAERDDVSHGLCPVCLTHYFPEAAIRRATLHPETPA